MVISGHFPGINGHYSGHFPEVNGHFSGTKLSFPVIFREMLFNISRHFPGRSSVQSLSGPPLCATRLRDHLMLESEYGFESELRLGLGLSSNGNQKCSGN